nr:uncharacterized protein LOC108017718 [Drosophila suzukii]
MRLSNFDRSITGAFFYTRPDYLRSVINIYFVLRSEAELYKIWSRKPRASVEVNQLPSAFSIKNRNHHSRINMKFFSVVTVFVLGLLALANAVPLSPDPGNVVINGDCKYCNVHGGK